MTEETVTTAPATEAPAVEKKESKSIVPARYANKYKGGGSDPLAEFIKAQCTGKEGFEFSAFFELNRKNGIAEEQVKKYEEQIAAKRPGSQGRTRMTLRNMLATIARKNGKLIALDGSEVAINLPKPVLTGAAAAAKAAAAEPKAEDSGKAGASAF